MSELHTFSRQIKTVFLKDNAHLLVDGGDSTAQGMEALSSLTKSLFGQVAALQTETGMMRKARSDADSLNTRNMQMMVAALQGIRDDMKTLRPLPRSPSNAGVRAQAS